MRTESVKGIDEIEVFRRFAGLTGLSFLSVEKRDPPEPDLLCQTEHDGPVAFELVELCDPNLAAAIATLSQDYIRTSDPSASIVRKKLKKSYETSAPIELVC